MECGEVPALHSSCGLARVPRKSIQQVRKFAVLFTGMNYRPEAAGTVFVFPRIPWSP